MKLKIKMVLLATTYLLTACGGGSGGSGGSPSGNQNPPTPVEPTIVLGGSPSAPSFLSLSLKNAVNNNSFNNYFKYSAVAGERLVIHVNLTTPLSDTQAARCASNPGTGATASSYASQIHVYNSNNVRLGGICGENLTYTFSETGTYVLNFEFPSNGSGFFNAASLQGDKPVKFSETGSGVPTEPKKLNTTSQNSIGSDPFFNYYWVSAVKGETIVVAVSLNQPLSTEQKTRCAANPGSHNSQIYVYDSKLNKVGLACGENIRFVVPENENYVFQFNYGAQSLGIANAAKN